MAQRSESKRDQGSSLIEVIAAAALIGVTATAIATASGSAATSSQRVLSGIEQTLDVDRSRSVISSDLTIHPNIDTSPLALDHLPGSNAFTLFSGETLSQVVPADVGIVSYRVVPEGDSWLLVRYRLENSTDNAENSERTFIARLERPPDDPMSEGEPSAADASSHAISVLSNGLERTVDIALAAGTRLRTAGEFTPVVTAPTTTAAPDRSQRPLIRCGGSVTIVMNTSSAIWSQGPPATVTGAVAAFISGLIGTASHVRIVAFDRLAYSFYPDVAVGSYVDIVDPSTSSTALFNKLTSLSTTSSSWRNGRNWEDGLWQATRRDTGTLLAHMPDLIVMITDGSPNRNRTNTSSDTDTTFHTADLSRAVTAADQARGAGATLIGILMGTGADSTAGGHLRSVFGTLTWDASSSVLPLDRARSFIRPTTEGFTKLEEVLRLIRRWRCAGTVTLRQGIVSGGSVSNASDTWTFEVTASDSTRPVSAMVDASRPATSVDFGASDSVAPRVVSISQKPRQGFVHDSVSCSVDGVTAAASTTIRPDGSTLVQIAHSPSTSLSCKLIARSAG